MADQPFIVNDRRRFTSEGENRPESEIAPPEEPRAIRNDGPADISSARLITDADPIAEANGTDAPTPSATPDETTPQAPPPPTAEESAQVSSAYTQTVDHLDTAVRAANPGMEPIPEMSFIRIAQSIYMNAIMQLGLAAPEGQQPRPDILAARQSIDMVGILAEKTKGNLTADEQQLLDTMLFELRISFIELTQAIGRAAQEKASPLAGAPKGPSIVR